MININHKEAVLTIQLKVTVRNNKMLVVVINKNVGCLIVTLRSSLAKNNSLELPSRLGKVM